MRPRDHDIGPGEEPELLDHPALPAAESARALADLDRVNRLLFATPPVRRALLDRLTERTGATVRLVDVGTGSGFVAARLAAAAGRRGTRVTVVGVDRKLDHLLAGRRRGIPQLRVVADVARLPFVDGAVHWSLSTLLFHHFGPVENRRILGEMRRVASVGAAVVDLRRSIYLRPLLRLLLPLVGAGRVAFHDGIVSARRAWPLVAVRALVAGLPVLELRRRFPFRFSLVLRATDAPARETIAPGTAWAREPS